MTDYRAVMDQVLKGWSVRQICSSLRCSHTTVQKARDALVEHNITTREQLRGVADQELADWFVDGRSHAQGDFVPIDFDAVAKASTGRKVTLQVLWGRYTAQPADTGQRYYSYDRFRQLVAQHVDAAGLTARITHAPGHTMQVDWAGTKMRLFDPTGGQGSKVSIFVASLPYSGMVFACACADERSDAWLAAHMRAFEYFGGVAEVIAPDKPRRPRTRPVSRAGIAGSTPLTRSFWSTTTPPRCRLGRNDPRIRPALKLQSRSSPKTSSTHSMATSVLG